MKIIYPHENGLAVINPNPDWPVEEVARKDVPAGVPYLIVDDASIPADRTYREAWESDFSAPHGYGIGAEAWFAEQAAKEAA
jgi:hypothetical protein